MSDDLEYGETSKLTEDEFDPRFVKIRITTMIDEDVLVGLKKIAQKRAKKYQTLLNEILRQYVSSHTQEDDPWTEDRIRKIVRDEIANHPRPFQSE